MEASKQGSTVVGLVSKTHAAFVALKLSPSDLARPWKKLYRIDDHMGMASAGLMSDARVLSNYMRLECMRERMVFDRYLPLHRIVNSVADKAQVNTQKYGGRPYGVGLLIIGADEVGPRLYECNSSGNYYDYRAMSIGSRSQSAKTYLEKHIDDFENCNVETLLVHGLRALREALPQDIELSSTNVAIGVVGVDPATTKLEAFKLLDDAERQLYVEKLQASDETMGATSRSRRAQPDPKPSSQGGSSAPGADTMETD